MIRHPQILNRQHSSLLIVDVQQKINAVMLYREQVVNGIIRLVKGCRILGVPIFITEQYPQGLGHTEPEILAALAGEAPLQKMTFSCCGANGLVEKLQGRGVRQIVVTGIECHVCVQQTALDLLANGFQVHIPRDAVSSRKALDYEAALERLALAGAVPTTVETVLFELMERADTPEFKEVSKLIK
ncbi:MAG TPA: hydrolase [bacterium]